MDPQRWEQIRELFDRAYTAPPEVRARLLNDVASEDEELRQEMTHLLSAYDGLGDFLDETPWPALPAMLLSNRYRLLSRLGEGGFAVVWLAQDGHLPERKVVVKLLRQELPHGSARELMLNREIDALSRLDHDRIVGILDRGTTPSGQPYLVLRYIPGQTLRQRLHRGPLEVEEARVLLGQLGEAIQAAHDQAVIHRDLKPENIILREEAGGVGAVVIDFGVAAILDRGNAESGFSLIAGTPAYLAPEQPTGRCSAASDEYSLAVVAFEMLTGVRLAGLVRELESPAAAALRTLPQLAPHLPSGAAAVLARALDFDANSRHPRIDLFTRALVKQLGPRSVPSRRTAFAVSALVVALGWLGFTLRDARRLPVNDSVEHEFRLARAGGAPRAHAPYMGVTLWQLRESEPVDPPGVRMLVHEGSAPGREFTPLRASAARPLREGERLRIGVEASSPGYLYVVTRERYREGWGDPRLIFPTLRIRRGDNRVWPGRITQIPDASDEPSYFTLQRSRQDHVEEVLTLLVTPEPLANLTARDEAQRLDPVLLDQWQRRWGTAVPLPENPPPDRQPQTVREREATAGSSLGPEEPLPQTLFRLNASEGAALLVTLPLRIAPTSAQ